MSLHLSLKIKQFLIHGHVSAVLLLATLLPLIKDKLWDHCSSANYRSIAVSSLFLKVFDWIVLLLYVCHLQLDEIQFGMLERVFHGQHCHVTLPLVGLTSDDNLLAQFSQLKQTGVTLLYIFRLLAS